MALVLIPQYFQMFFVQPISYGNKFFVPAVVSHFISAKEENRRPARVKGEENPIGFASVLSPKFLHVWKFRVLDSIDVRPTE
jgi:hypothetical protein